MTKKSNERHGHTNRSAKVNADIYSMTAALPSSEDLRKALRHCSHRDENLSSKGKDFTTRSTMINADTCSMTSAPHPCELMRLMAHFSLRLHECYSLTKKDIIARSGKK